jgi:putative endonuclease
MEDAATPDRQSEGCPSKLEGAPAPGSEVGLAPGWWYVYRLQSIASPENGYTGATQNLRRRLQQHNSGENRSTAADAPFRVVFAAAFPTKVTALAFESYLKTGSGIAFGRKRLWA